MKRKLMGWALGAAASMMAVTAATAGTLDDVKAKGFVQCGVSQGLPGFSNPDASNNWSGMDVDFCRAVAAAIFNDPTKVKFSPLSAKERFTALQSGDNMWQCVRSGEPPVARPEVTDVVPGQGVPEGGRTPIPMIEHGSRVA